MLISFLKSDAFREIFQSMSEGIIIVDERGFIVVSEQIFGYEKSDFVGNQMERLLPQRYRVRLSIQRNVKPTS